MYALHPGSLAPEDPKSQTRRPVTADDLVRLYKLPPHEYIVWDPRDGYDWFDFIHLYPSYYGRYTLLKDGTPDKDLPCESSLRLSGGRRGGKGFELSAAATSTRAPRRSR